LKKIKNALKTKVKTTQPKGRLRSVRRIKKQAKRSFFVRRGATIARANAREKGQA
jgi:hypothetical protein